MPASASIGRPRRQGWAPTCYGPPRSVDSMAPHHFGGPGPPKSGCSRGARRVQWSWATELPGLWRALQLRFAGARPMDADAPDAMDGLHRVAALEHVGGAAHSDRRRLDNAPQGLFAAL